MIRSIHNDVTRVRLGLKEWIVANLGVVNKTIKAAVKVYKKEKERLNEKR